MKKNLKIGFALILLFGFLQQSFAQIKEVKQKSSANKSSKQANTSKSTTHSGDTNDDACSAACMDACVGACSSVAIDLIIDGQGEYLDNKDDIPHMVSLEIMPHGAYFISNNDFNTMPRIRGNWAMFSTDLRFNSWFEFEDGNIDFFHTFDWQVIEFNPIILENFILRLGTGLMHETYSKTTYNEHFLGSDIMWDDDSYLINIEGRWAKDYNTGADPRTEANLRFNYRFLEQSNFDGYFMVGGLYQNYYNQIDLWGLQTGVTFFIH